jgi:hypothetical protein
VSRFRVSAVALVLLLFVAACTSDAGPDADATPTAEPTPEATPESTPAPEPTLGEGAGDLAAILPTEVGGLTIEYQHSSGAAVLGSDAVTPEARAFFDSVGAEPSDLSSAFGIAFDQEAGSVLTIIAFRVAGADEGQLRDEFLTVLEAEPDQEVSEESLGGKDVLAFGAVPSDSQAYLYVQDDVIYIIGGQPLALAEEALAALP